MLSGKKLINATMSLTMLIIGINGTVGGAESAVAIDISGGENHTLVLTASKSVWACGPNGDPVYHTYYGVLGIASNDYSLTEWTLIRVHGPDDEGYLQDIDDIDAGWKHSLAVDASNFVWAWGWNSEGQLGDGSDDPHSTPVQVRGGQMGTPYLQNIDSISAGRSGEHSLAVDSSGLVYAWGRNEEGQLGNGDSGPDERELTPVKVKGVNGQGDLDDIFTVSAGEQHSMALGNDARVYTWGDNLFQDGERRGKLGNGDTTSNLVDTPVLVLRNDNSEPLENIVGISAGWDHSMALDTGGYVYTWGNNGECYDSDGGRLGDGTTTDRSKAVKVVGVGGSGDLDNIEAISAGEGHSMALDTSGYVYCWGDNYYGQLGDGTNDHSPAPVQVVGPDGDGYLENIVAISAGFWHSLAIDSDGTIWVWGKGTYGRLGIGTTGNANIPQRVPVVYNNTQGTSYFRIQAAIDDAATGDVIEASRGTYSEYIDFLGKAVTVKSTEPINWEGITSTIIDAYNYRDLFIDAVAFAANEDTDSVLRGFTITSRAYGYGIYCEGSSPTISRCLITNSGTSTGRAGMYCYDYASPRVTNCVLAENGSAGGGGMHNRMNSNPIVTHCTFWYNGRYANSYEMWNVDSSPIVTNCIFWGEGYQILNHGSSNPTVSYCCVRGGYPQGDYIISDDPLLTADYHLTYESPCADAGTSTPPGGLPEKDIDGNPRKMGPDVDMGADEDYPHCMNTPHYDYYADWVAMGRPDCWCASPFDGTYYQCDGDADGKTETFFNYRIYGRDLNLVVENWKRKIDDPLLDPCADIDHEAETFFKYRVYGKDLGIVVANWKKKDRGDPYDPETQLPNDCADCERWQEARAAGGAEPSFEELLKRLAEIWLDPEVRKVIDEDAWLKLVESLKQDIEKPLPDSQQ